MVPPAAGVVTEGATATSSGTVCDIQPVGFCTWTAYILATVFVGVSGNTAVIPVHCCTLPGPSVQPVICVPAADATNVVPDSNRSSGVLLPFCTRYSPLICSELDAVRQR